LGKYAGIPSVKQGFQKKYTNCEVTISAFDRKVIHFYFLPGQPGYFFSSAITFSHNLSRKRKISQFFNPTAQNISGEPANSYIYGIKPYKI